jgi:hypothetical protein
VFCFLVSPSRRSFVPQVRKSNAARVKYVVSFAAANAANAAAHAAAHAAAVAGGNSPGGTNSPGGKSHHRVASDASPSGDAPASVPPRAAAAEAKPRSGRDGKAAASPKALLVGANAAAPVLAHDWRRLDVFRAFEWHPPPVPLSNGPLAGAPGPPVSRQAATPGVGGVAAGSAGFAAAVEVGDGSEMLAIATAGLTLQSPGAGGGASGGKKTLPGCRDKGGDNGSGGGGGSGVAEALARACSGCTFLNESAAAEACEMCGTHLPPLSPRPGAALALGSSSSSSSSSSGGHSPSSSTQGRGPGSRFVGWSLLSLPAAALQRVVALSTDAAAAHVASLSTRHRAAAKADEAFRRSSHMCPETLMRFIV